jgi:hypothetical protein
MTKEDIKYVITAEDKATATLRKSSQEVKELSNQVRGSGEKFKASTELAGAFANTLGNSNIGGAAGQIAQLTERMTAFAGATDDAGIALKLGLAGAAAFVGFELGQFLSGSRQYTQTLNDELEKTKSLVQAIGVASQTALANVDFTIGLEGDSQSQLEQQRDIVATLERNLVGAADKLKAYRDELNKTVDVDNDFGIIPGSNVLAKGQQALDKNREILKAQIEEQEAIYKRFTDEVEARTIAINRLEEQQAAQRNVDSAAFLAQQEKQLDALTLSKEAQRELAIVESTTAGPDRDRAIALNRQITAAEKRLQQEKDFQAELKKNIAEATRFNEKKLAEADRIDKLTMSTAQNLKIQALQMAGQTADAEAYRLTLQGVDEDTASRLAQLKDTLGTSKSQAHCRPQPTPPANRVYFPGGVMSQRCAWQRTQNEPQILVSSKKSYSTT